MSVSVCVWAYLSVRDHIFGTTRPIVTNFFVHVNYGRGSIPVWRRSDKLCTSGFMDDVTSAQKPRLSARRRRPAEAQYTRSLGLGYKLMCGVIPVAGQRAHGTTFRALKLTTYIHTYSFNSPLNCCIYFYFFS